MSFPDSFYPPEGYPEYGEHDFVEIEPPPTPLRISLQELMAEVREQEARDREARITEEWEAAVRRGEMEVIRC